VFEAVLGNRKYLFRLRGAVNPNYGSGSGRAPTRTYSI
jgi:hypothetical protein